MNNKLINWNEIYQDPALFHIYLTERKRGKTDCKAWTMLEQIVAPNSTVKYAWLRRHWHDSLECTKPYFQDLIYKFCEEFNENSPRTKNGSCEDNSAIKPSAFEVQEQGLFYQGKKRIYFFDLFSFRKARGKIARGTNFSVIVYEEAIPIDQEVLPWEQWKLRDFIQGTPPPPIRFRPPFFQTCDPGSHVLRPSPIISLRKYFPPIPGPFRPREAGGGRRGGGWSFFFNKMTYPPHPPLPPVLFNFHFLMKACFPTLRKHVLPEYQAKLR
nr:hypothetical protein [Morchella crassipes]